MGVQDYLLPADGTVSTRVDIQSTFGKPLPTLVAVGTNVGSTPAASTT